MFKFFIVMLFSFTIFANNQSILKNINKNILDNKQKAKVSFIVFNLDNTILNISARYESLFNNYLKKHHSRIIKKYFEDKNFVNVALKEVLEDISSLKINKKKKKKLLKYLKENYYSSIAINADVAMGDSIYSINHLYKNGAFIVYVTKRDLKQLSATINRLKDLNFPIAKPKTMLIMNVNDGNIVNTLSDFINMGEIIAVFNSSIKSIKKLTPYFSKDKLFFISKDNLDSKDFTIIKSL